MKAETLKLAKDVVEDLTQYIACYLGEDQNEAELAERIGFSESYCCRSFSAITGETIAGFRRRLRLELAAALMIATPWPLSQIARQADYLTAEGPVRAFSRKFGCTPSQFRSSNRSSTRPFRQRANGNGFEPLIAIRLCTRLGEVAAFSYDHKGRLRSVSPRPNHSTNTSLTVCFTGIAWSAALTCREGKDES